MDLAAPLVVDDERFRAYDFGPGHPFTETSRWLSTELLRQLESDHAIPEGTVRWSPPVEPASRSELLRFHRTEYVERVEALGTSGRRALLDAGDTPSFPGCHEAAARIVGGTLAGLIEVRRGGGWAAINPAGGLHHAHPDRASGFCIFNDVAVAIAAAFADGLRRVAYIDIDAHHGDGVMYGFYGDGRLLDIDFHQDGRTLFPGTGFVSETGRGDGAGRKVNVPLPPGAGDLELLDLFRRLVPPLLEEFRPELVVLQNGVDGHVGDRLGQTALEYTPTAYRSVIAELRAIAVEEGGPRLLVTGGGGYSAENVARILAAVPLWLARGPTWPLPALPSPWRAEFSALTGEPAPTDWQVPAPSNHPPGGTVERLVDQLERALGRRFPLRSESAPSTG